jgi:hypothetical protein
MDRVFDLRASLLQPVGHLAQGMLRLRHRHVVARHDDHLARILHEVSSILRRAEFHGLLLGAGRRLRL